MDIRINTILIEQTDTCLISGLNGSVLNLYDVDGQSTVDVQAGDTKALCLS